MTDQITYIPPTSTPENPHNQVFSPESILRLVAAVGLVGLAFTAKSDGALRPLRDACPAQYWVSPLFSNTNPLAFEVDKPTPDNPYTRSTDQLVKNRLLSEGVVQTANAPGFYCERVVQPEDSQWVPKALILTYRKERDKTLFFAEAKPITEYLGDHFRYTFVAPVTVGNSFRNGVLGLTPIVKQRANDKPIPRSAELRSAELWALNTEYEGSREAPWYLHVFQLHTGLDQRKAYTYRLPKYVTKDRYHEIEPGIMSSAAQNIYRLK